MTITVPAAKIVAAQTDFPVVVTRACLPNSVCDPLGSSVVQADGGDLRITTDASGTTLVPLDVVSFAHDSATGAADASIEFWFKAPSLSTSVDTVFHLWGAASTTQSQPSVTDTHGRNAVWSECIGAWHFNAANGVALIPDSTGGGGDITVVGASSVSWLDNLSGIELRGDGDSGDSAALGASTDQDYTFSAMLRAAGVATSGKDICELVNDDSVTALNLHTAGSQRITFYNMSFQPYANSWQRYSCSSPVGSGVNSYYVNGVLQDSVTQNRADFTTSLQLKILPGATDKFGGSGFAQITLRKGISSADWLVTEYANQNDPATFAVGSPVGPTPITTAVTVVEVLEQSFPTPASSHDVTLPASVDAGDLLLLLTASLDLFAPNPPTGWTTVNKGGFSTAQLGVYALVATGDEGGTTVNVDIPGAEPSPMASQMYRVTNWYGDLSGIEAASFALAVSAAPDPGVLTPSWGSADTLWLAVVASGDDGALASAAPADYADLLTTQSAATADASCSLASARRALTAASEDPGTFTWAASQSLTATTVAIRPAVTSASVTVDVGVGTLTVMGKSHQVAAGQSLGLSPGSLIFAGQSLNPSAGQSQSAGAGTLALTGAAMQSAAGQAIQVGAGALGLAGQTHGVSAGQSSHIGAGSVSFTGQTPQPAAGQSNSLSAGSLSFTGRQSQTQAGQSLAIQPGTLTILGQALSVQIGTDVPVNIAIGAGSLSLTTKALLTQAGFSADAGAGAIDITGQPLAVSAGMVEAIGPATLTLAGQALSITAGARLSVDIGAGTLSLSGSTISQVAGVEAAITAGLLAISGQTLVFSTGGPLQIDSARLVVIHAADRVAVISDFDRIVRIH